MGSIQATTGSSIYQEMHLAASATASIATSHSPREKISAVRSCLACQKRKVRCNRDHPCENCVKGSMACIYPAHTRRRPRGLGKKNENYEEMRTRVARLEELLQNLRGSGEKGNGSRLLDKGGQSLYIGNAFWASLSDEVCF